MARYAMLAICGALIAASGCTRATHGGAALSYVDDSKGHDWPGYGRTFGEQHFSPLSEINAGDVSRLGLAWSMDLDQENSVTQPIEVAGVLYFVTGYGVVHAVDAATGKPLWRYDPETWRRAGKKLRDAWGTRGLAWWNGKIYAGAQDGRLYALDARTGKLVWSAMTVAPDDMNYITGAPRVFAGKVIVGFGGADVGPARGYVSAYDAETGKLLWRWYTVPGNPAKGFENKAMEMAAKTWAGEWWKDGGGGTVWNAISYDPVADTVFIGTGNGTPWNIKARSKGLGDNLFLCSIVALDGKTGSYKWHYQVNPGETWDYTATMDMALATLKIDGRDRKVLMTAPKNGFFYVIDRTNGKLISAEPITKVSWASKIDLATGRPVENPAARYPNGSVFVMWPRTAHSWNPMAYSPATGLAYIPVLKKADSWEDFGLEHDAWRAASPLSTGQAAAIRNPFPATDDPENGTSWLQAWNTRAQKLAWKRQTPGPVNGGVMATGGGLVFQGQLDGAFNAYAADTGKLLWSFQTHAPVIAPPISYEAGGRQYVTVLTGMGTSFALMGPPLANYRIDFRTQPRRVLTFVLDANKQLPPPVKDTLTPVADPGYRPDEAQEKLGARVFGIRCAPCHGIGAIAAGAAPDLRTSSVPLSSEAFQHVVREGALLPAGMPRFEELSDAELGQLRQYIRAQAAAWRAGPGAGGQVVATAAH
jgi:quinohemoprotein ethanol dehydrogenase